MKLNDIVETLKGNGFAESEKSKRRMVHPENTDFIIELYDDKECDEIQIGDLYNSASFPVSSIRSFRITPNPEGIYFNIKLDIVDCEINLFCYFN